MKFELDLSRVKNRRTVKPAPDVQEGNSRDGGADLMPVSDEMVSMSVATAVVGLGLAFGVGMLCGYSTGFKLGKTVGQAIGMSASYAQVARMAVRM